MSWVRTMSRDPNDSTAQSSINPRAAGSLAKLRNRSMNALSRDMAEALARGARIALVRSAACRLTGNIMATLVESDGAPDADPHGRGAPSPRMLPLRAWWEIFGRVWVKAGTDNIGLLAA